MNMFILLDKERAVEDVQAEFNNAYPYLKMDFTKRERTQANVANRQQGENKPIIKIGDLNVNIQPCQIEVTDQMTVNELEKQVLECINVPVKILRKSGNIWLETSITGNWTLLQQNAHAK